MKIVTTPTSAVSSRDEWIRRFLSHCRPYELPSEVPTGYRDLGAAVRFSFHSGYVIEWPWQDTRPLQAVREARNVGAVSDVVAGVGDILADTEE